MSVHDKRAVLIAGPTASGKSALALSLAQKYNGVVINTDSMQVYRDLQVITARPSEVDEARAPHKLYGHVDASENYSAGRFCREAEVVIADAWASGKLPILVGGTGLYFKALTGGLTAIPAITADLRAALRARLASEGVAALHAELSQRDPVTAARLMPKDQSRILRALEVFEATGRSLSDWHREGTRPILDPDKAIRVFLDVDREALKNRIEKRFGLMLSAGALEEVRKLDARGLRGDLPAMKAHGVPWLRRHLQGTMSLADAALAATIDTRRYAKRQVTWFRNQMPGWSVASPDDAARMIEDAIARG